MDNGWKAIITMTACCHDFDAYQRFYQPTRAFSPLMNLSHAVVLPGAQLLRKRFSAR